MRSQQGFTLIEIIAAVVLIGAISIFAAIFISSGTRSMYNARLAEENGQKAQAALNRIALELRDVNGGVGSGGAPQVLSGTSIVYTTSQTAYPGTRTLAYSSGSRTITLRPAAGGTAYTLVDGVSSCTMSFLGTTTDNSITFTVRFTLSNSGGTYSITVKPRNAIPTPLTS